MPAVVWTDEATQKLIELFNSGMSRDEMARNLGTTRAAVYQKLHRLGICSSWKADPLAGQEDLVIEYAAEGRNDTWIAKKLGASAYRVRNLRRRLKINSSPPKSWSRHEDDLLISMVRLGNLLKDVAKQLGRSEGACWCRLALLRRDGTAERREAPQKTREIKAGPPRLLPLEEAERDWDELLGRHYPEDSDRKPFATKESIFRKDRWLDGDDPGDNGPCVLPEVVQSYGLGGSMGWAA